jgi:DNA-binding Lrp family transcriptional regulator
MSNSISGNLLYDEPFVAVFPSLVRLLDGDVASAAVLQHINFRSNSRSAMVDHTGEAWYPVTREDLADEIGLTPKQVKRIIEKLRVKGILLVQQSGGIDRRNFYRIDLNWADALVPNGTDGRDPNGTDGTVPNGTDVPSIKELEQRKDLRTMVRKPVDGDPAFDEFWNQYPRREAKGAARRAWLKAVREVPASEIIDAAARYRDDPNRDPAFTAHPATWLNGERWLDSPLPERNDSRSDKKVDEVRDVIARARARDMGALEA